MTRQWGVERRRLLLLRAKHLHNLLDAAWKLGAKLLKHLQDAHAGNALRNRFAC